MKILSGLLLQIQAHDNRLTQTFEKHSGLNTERTSEYLQYDEGPILQIGSLSLVSASGETMFDDYQGSVTSTLQKRHINKLERLGVKLDKLSSKEGVSKSRLAKVQVAFNKLELEIEKTILHEGVHQGDYEANGDFTDSGTDSKYIPGKQGQISKERGNDFDKEF